MSDSRDENLLFGILALQLDFINQEQLVEAANKWMVAKQSKLGEILVAQGAISREDCDFVRTIVEKHVARSGSPKSSLELLKQHEPIAEAKDQLQTIFDGDGFNGNASQYATRGDATTVWTPEEGHHGSRFVRLRHLASGGLGVVSVARDQELDRDVALKELSDRKRTSIDAYERFIAEAKITGNLEHPSIVPIYGLGVTLDGSPYYAMRLIRGKSLQEEITQLHRKRGSSNNEHALDFSKFDAEHLRKLLRSLAMACNAVAYANSRGVIHRDLKPGNIMLGKFGETIVVDWGLAKAKGVANDSPLRSEAPVQDSRDGESSATVMGSVLGTHGYMAPEQAHGRLDLIDQRSDVFGLGACLYSILSNHVPFQGNTKAESLENARNYKLTRLRELDSQIPRTLEAVCLKAMAAEPKDRYQQATELADDIDRWIAGEAVSAMRDPWLQRAFRWARKNQALVSSSAVLLVTTLVALAVASIFINEQRKIANTARDEAKLAANESDRQRKIADEALLKSQQSNTDSIEIIARFVEKLADDGWANVPHMEAERLSMVDAAVSRFKKLLEDNPDDIVLKQRVVRIMIRSANLYRMVGKIDTAGERYGDAMEVIKSLEATGQLKEVPLSVVGDAIYGYTNLVEEQKGSEGALVRGKQGVDICQIRLNQSPKDIGAKLGLMMALTQCGSLHLDLGEFNEASSTSAEALRLFGELEPTPLGKQSFLPLFQIVALETQTKALVEQKQFEDAASKIKELTNAADAAKAKFPTDANIEFFTVQTLSTSAKLDAARGNLDAALNTLNDLNEKLQSIISRFSDVADYQRALLRSLADAGTAAYLEGDISTAKDFSQQFMEKIDLTKIKADEPVSQLKATIRPLALAFVLARRDGNVPNELAEKFQAIQDKLKAEDPRTSVLKEVDYLLEKN